MKSSTKGNPGLPTFYLAPLMEISKFSGSGVRTQDVGVPISDINLLMLQWTQLYPKWNSLLLSDLQSCLCQYWRRLFSIWTILFSQSFCTHAVFGFITKISFINILLSCIMHFFSMFSNNIIMIGTVTPQKLKFDDTKLLALRMYM